MRTNAKNGNVLTMAHCYIITRLAETPLNMTTLSYALSMTSAGATTSIDSLEKFGIVRRTAHPSDRRQKMVVLTPYGEKINAGIRRQFAYAVAENDVILALRPIPLPEPDDEQLPS